MKCVHEFRISVDEEQISDLKRRLRETRYVPNPHNKDEEEGVSVSEQRRFIDYWRDSYDWKAAEKRINDSMPQFIAEDVQGESIHFVWRHSPENREVILLCHGWPGSFIEFERVMDLIDSSFDLVIPSMPGYGFSSYRTDRAINLSTIGDIYHELMTGLGYDRYYVQGGDWGAHVASWMAYHYPKHVKAFHLNFLPGSYMPDDTMRQFTLSEKKYFDEMAEFRKDGIGYDEIQATRPLTLAAALNDSPAGMAIWLYEKFRSWSDRENSLGITLTDDRILDDISIYWFTQTIYSSCRLYQEALCSKLRFAEGERIIPPMGFTAFPAEFAIPPRELLERVYDVRYYNAVEAGGHFAAMEQPEILAAEINAFFCEIQ